MARCQLLTIQVEEFALAMQQHFTVRSFAAEYGRIFAERVMSAKPPRSEWPDDIETPFCDYGEVVVSMPQVMQVTIGSLAIDHCKNRFLSKDVQTTLREEVDDGRSIVILSLDGLIERVVSVVVMHIVREDGRVLVQLAKWDRDQATPAFKLPGCKCKRNEASDDAIQRLLTTELGQMVANVEVLRVERNTKEAESGRFSVRTVYMRKLVFARLEDTQRTSQIRQSEDRRSSYVGDSSIIVADITKEGKAAMMSHRLSATAIHKKSKLTRGAERALRALQGVEVHYSSLGEGLGQFYAWIRECDLEHQEALKNCPAVLSWLSTLSPPPDVLEAQFQGSVYAV